MRQPSRSAPGRALDASPLRGPPPASPWLVGALGLLATALPFGIAVARAASSGQWRDDLPAVRDLGLVAVGVGGGLSTLVTQALSLMPLGPRSFRAALGSAVALAFGARLLYGIVRRALSAAGPSPRLAAALAAIATLTAALSPTWQREATVGGGAMLAIALSLAVLARALDLARASAQRPPASAYLALGALAGAALAESPPAGLAVLAALASLPLVHRYAGVPGPAPRAPSRRVLVSAGALGAAVALLLLAPLALRPLAPGAWADIGRVLSAESLGALDVASARTTALGAWVHEIGLASLGIAAFGAGVAVLRPRLRPFLAPFLVLVALDTLFPARAAGVLSADPLTALRALAIAALAAASALGVHEVVAVLLRARVPMAKSGAVLVVVFHLTLVALTSEEAGYAADRSEQLAAEVWADEALGALEPSAAILVRSPAIAWRLWAARLTRGERPDVVVIPVPLLSRGRVAASLVATDRSLEPLLRDVSLTGEPSEFALSTIADVHPLRVEIDRTWSKRLATHLLARGLWLEYVPEPLGPSDRKLGAAASMVTFRRVLAALEASAVPDASTSSVVAEGLRAQVDVLSLLGERDVADLLQRKAVELHPLDPDGPLEPLRRAVTGVRRAVAGRMPSRAR